MNKNSSIFSLYRNVIIASAFSAPFLNRYAISPLNFLIAVLLGLLLGIIACVFHYELFYRGKRVMLPSLSINKLCIGFSFFVIIVDAVGRASLVGMMKMHWIMHLSLMALVYLFLGAIVVAESLRSRLPVTKVFLLTVLMLFCIRAVILFFMTGIFAVPFLYSVNLLLLSSVIGCVMLVPGAVIAYYNREYFVGENRHSLFSIF